MSTKPAALTATLAKGLDVLEALADEDDASLTELARRLGVSAATLFRILSTLAARGYAEKSADSRYRLTLKPWELGARAVRRLGLRDLARPFMEGLAAETGEAVHLSVLQGDGIVIIDKVDSPHPVRVETYVGLRAPAHCSATGKAILAFATTATRDAVLSHALERYTDATVIDRAALLRELEQVRRQGWARNRGEWRDGVSAAAVPLLDKTKAVLGALSVTVPSARWSNEALRDRLLPPLKEAGDAISTRIAKVGR